jgi:hypothetical protein
MKLRLFKRREKKCNHRFDTMEVIREDDPLCCYCRKPLSVCCEEEGLEFIKKTY